jgi:hypothetical protein
MGVRAIRNQDGSTTWIGDDAPRIMSERSDATTDDDKLREARAIVKQARKSARKTVRKK